MCNGKMLGLKTEHTFDCVLFRRSNWDFHHGVPRPTMS